MADSRRRRHVSPRRTTSWLQGVTEQTGSTTAANVVREVALFVPLEDHEGATVIRIVGSVGMWLQADSLFVPQSLCWGIYKAGSGSDGDLQLDPSSPLDRESEHWMHQRYLYRNTDFDTLAISADTLEQSVDIKVMRKIQEGDGIKLAFNCVIASYVSIANLRVLVKHT